MKIELETTPNIIIAYHGCDEIIANNVILGKERLRDSNNAYDWLGHGQYFWENNKSRALSWAKELKSEHPLSCINKPDVIGAVIKPGICLDLTDEKCLGLVKFAYDEMRSLISEEDLPKNKGIAGSRELLLRYLDCAVIEYLHSILKKRGMPIDTVRGVFVEGSPLYPNAGFRAKTHIQICVVNPKCIIGYFRPR